MEEITPSGSCSFQFHKGTIRTWRVAKFQRFGYEFQFHKGTIRTHIGLNTEYADANFNSIKVRLELFYENVNNGQFPLFQFHKGTIRTFCGLYSFSTYKISIP